MCMYRLKQSLYQLRREGRAASRQAGELFELATSGLERTGRRKAMRHLVVQSGVVDIDIGIDMDIDIEIC